MYQLTDNYDTKTLYITDYPASWDEEPLKEYFSQFGEIKSAFVKIDKHAIKGNTYAFVEFINDGCVEKAMLQHEHYIKDIKIGVQNAKKREQATKNTSSSPVIQEVKNRICIKHMPRNISKQELEDYFKTLGEILSVFIYVGQDNSQGDMAFINFVHSEDAMKAVNIVHNIKSFALHAAIAITKSKDRDRNTRSRAYPKSRDYSKQSSDYHDSPYSSNRRNESYPSNSRSSLPRDSDNRYKSSYDSKSNYKNSNYDNNYNRDYSSIPSTLSKDTYITSRDPYSKDYNNSYPIQKQESLTNRNIYPNNYAYDSKNTSYIQEQNSNRNNYNESSQTNYKDEYNTNNKSYPQYQTKYESSIPYASTSNTKYPDEHYDSYYHKPNNYHEEPSYDMHYDPSYDTHYDKPYDTPTQPPYDAHYDKPYDAHYDKPYDAHYDKPYDISSQPYDAHYDKPYDSHYDKPYDPASDSKRVPIEDNKITYPLDSQASSYSYPNPQSYSNTSQSIYPPEQPTIYPQDNVSSLSRPSYSNEYNRKNYIPQQPQYRDRSTYSSVPIPATQDPSIYSSNSQMSLPYVPPSIPSVTSSIPSTSLLPPVFDTYTTNNQSTNSYNPNSSITSTRPTLDSIPSGLPTDYTSSYNYRPNNYNNNNNNNNLPQPIYNSKNNDYIPPYTMNKRSNTGPAPRKGVSQQYSPL